MAARDARGGDGIPAAVLSRGADTDGADGRAAVQAEGGRGGDGSGGLIQRRVGWTTMLNCVPGSLA